MINIMKWFGWLLMIVGIVTICAIIDKHIGFLIGGMLIGVINHEMLDD